MTDAELAQEEWRDIPDAPGYKVSNMGRVKGRKGQLMRIGLNANGYPSVWFCSCSPKRRTLHRTVLTAFVGPKPEGMQARHLDGNKLNAKLSNLAWGTGHENGQDRVGHGTQANGERNGASKLTEEQVARIRAAYAAPRKGIHWGAVKFAKEFGVAQTTVVVAAQGKTWKNTGDKK